MSVEVRILPPPLSYLWLKPPQRFTESSMGVLSLYSPNCREEGFSETQRCQGMAKGRGPLASLGLWPYMFVLPSLG